MEIFIDILFLSQVIEFKEVFMLFDKVSKIFFLDKIKHVIFNQNEPCALYSVRLKYSEKFYVILSIIITTYSQFQKSRKALLNYWTYIDTG